MLGLGWVAVLPGDFNTSVVPMAEMATEQESYNY